MSGLRVALVGYGYWGPNLARTLDALPGVELAVVCDEDPERRAEARRVITTTRAVASYVEVLAAPDVDAVVVATPALTHYDLACRGLAAGKHVLVEKPLAMRATECEELGRRADHAGLTLMVGHTFLYNAAVRRVREHLRRGELGDVFHVHAQRLNWGVIRQDVNVLWNLAPHDVSILLYLLETDPAAVRATGQGFLRRGHEDVVFVTLEFPGGCLGHLHASWLDPRKVRQVTVVGTKGTIVYDDIDTEARIRVYDEGVEVSVPELEFEEPLRVECREFVDAIIERRPPLTDARHAARVVRVLEAADASLRAGGERIELRDLPAR